MKKFLCTLLAALSAFSLTSCTSEDISTPAVSETSQTVEYSSEEVYNETDESASEETEMISDVSENLKETSAEAYVEFTTAEIEAEEYFELPDEDASYTSKDDVALYIHVYEHLPQNFITKKEAEALGWTGGSVESYAPGKCIGGSRFGNYEGLLPEDEDRNYYECDIDTLGAANRGAKRIVYSDDGLIYYTEDHYETFELIYGEDS